MSLAAIATFDQDIEVITPVLECVDGVSATARAATIAVCICVADNVPDILEIKRIRIGSESRVWADGNAGAIGAGNETAWAFEDPIGIGDSSKIIDAVANWTLCSERPHGETAIACGSSALHEGIFGRVGRRGESASYAEQDSSADLHLSE